MPALFTGRRAVLLGAVALVPALAACSSSGSGAGTKGRAGDAASTSRVARVTVSNAKGCPAEHGTYRAGPLTFKVSNTDATAVSEVELLDGDRIVGEKENLPPGFSGEFAVNISSGTYRLYCPGGSPQYSTLKIVGKSQGPTDSTVAALLEAGSKGYAGYVDTQVAALVTSVGKLNDALHGTNLTAAQSAYMKARPYYEKIEPVAESFLSLDSAIDARANDVPAAKWTGFHRIEKGLFQQKSLRGMASYGTGLVGNVAKLQARTKNLTYQPTELANGAQGLLDEVASSKITGEEERYSHIDLLDFANNDEGAEQAFAQLQPALTKIDPVLVTSIVKNFAALDKLVGTYRTTSNASGYVLYGDLTASDKRALAAAVKAVQQPLSKVASKVANA